MSGRPFIQCLSLAHCVFACVFAQTPPQAGKFLVAARDLGDSNFAESVVLLISYSPQGAMGLIVNRPSEVPATQVAPKTKWAGNVYFGGPVEMFRLFALQRTPGVEQIVPGVQMLSDRALIDKALKSSAPDGLRLFAGYAGWGPGQLDREMRLKSWFVLNATAALVFDGRPETLWNRLIRKTELISARNVFAWGGFVSTETP